MTKTKVTNEAELRGFEKALKVMYKLSKEGQEAHRIAAQPFLEEFAKIHQVVLKK